MNLLKKLLGQNEIDPQLAALTHQELIVVMQTETPNFDLRENRDPEALKEWLTESVNEVAEAPSAKMFEYEDRGLILIPVFTTSESVSNWAKQNPFDQKGAFGIGTWSLKPGALFPQFAGAPPHVCVILDPKNPGERLLTIQEMRILSTL